ncbi:unnamed protein product, partial [Polarella glacialis]
DPVPVEVEIQDGRGMGFTLDDNGFCLLPHEWDHVDYNDNDQVVNKYYAECEAIVRRQTGASRVLAFDHNVRAKQRKDAGGRLRGGSAVQEPLITCPQRLYVDLGAQPYSAVGPTGSQQ